MHAARVHWCRSRERAVSLVEVLVVIAVLAILVALAVPALRSARFRGADAVSLTRQREFHGMVVLYCQDHREQFPYLATPGDPLGPIAVRGTLIAPEVSSGYFRTQAYYWASALFPSYCPSRAALELAWGAERRGKDRVTAEEVVATPMWMTHATLAGSEYFADPEPPNRPEMFRSTRLGEVLWPSQKGLIIDITVGVFSSDQTASRSAMASVGACDGAAAMRNWAQAAEPVVRPFGSITWPVMAAPDGLRGKDFR